MREFRYSTVAFVPDPVRQDRINIAAIVLDPERGKAEFKRVGALRSRMRALSAGTRPEAIEAFLNELDGWVSGNQSRLWLGADEPLSAARLESLAANLGNQVQLSETRNFWADSLTDALSRVSRIHLAGNTRTAGGDRSRSAIRRSILKTVSSWELGPYRLEETRIKRGPSSIPHQADFWLVNGRVDAALYALTDHADDVSAITLRDSLPTVLDDFRTANPDFKVVAVTAGTASPLLAEASEFLERHGVLVATADGLDEFQERLLPGMFSPPSA